MRRQAEEAGVEVETLLGSDPPLHQEAWHRLQGWYQAAVNRAPPPARVTLERIKVERLDLYIYVPTLGANITISVETFLLDDSVPTEDDIEWTVKQLQNHRFRGLSRMRDEHLKGWLAAARKKDKEEATAGEETADSIRVGRIYGIYGGIQLVDGGKTLVDGVQAGVTGGGCHVAGNGPVSQGGKGLLWYFPRGGDVQGSEGGFKSPYQSLHHLPRLTPRISGGLRHMYRHRQCQDSSALSGLEGGGPVRNIPGPAQGV